MKIRWTKRALNTIDQVLEYLELDWGIVTSEKFAQSFQRNLKTLSQTPRIGKTYDKKRGIRAFVISKHITIYYRIKNEVIIILQVFVNKQNPSKRV